MHPHERKQEDGVLTAIEVEPTVPRCRTDGIVGLEFS